MGSLGGAWYVASAIISNSKPCHEIEAVCITVVEIWDDDTGYSAYDCGKCYLPEQIRAKVGCIHGYAGKSEQMPSGTCMGHWYQHPLFDEIQTLQDESNLKWYGDEYIVFAIRRLLKKAESKKWYEDKQKDK